MKSLPDETRPADAYPPEWAWAADKGCADCGGPLGFPFSTTERGHSCMPCHERIDHDGLACPTRGSVDEPWMARPAADGPFDHYYGLSRTDFLALAKYNSERGLGLEHPAEWREAMARLQATYDDGLLTFGCRR